MARFERDGTIIRDGQSRPSRSRRRRRSPPPSWRMPSLLKITGLYGIIVSVVIKFDDNVIKSDD